MLLYVDLQFTQKPWSNIHVARGVAALSELAVIALDDELANVLPEQMEIIPFKELAKAIGFEKSIWNSDGM